MASSEIAQAEDASGLAALIARAAPPGKSLPPVDRWEPELSVDLDMEIRADGTWYYQGTVITREALVRLFSTVLRKDADGLTYLVTPVEKVAIRVEDAPFIAVEMRFETTGDNGGLKPYLHVRGRLEALASRAVMYEIAALGQAYEIDGTQMFAVASAGAVFPIMTMQQLETQSQ
jgi:hypothetical protein